MFAFSSRQGGVVNWLLALGPRFRAGRWCRRRTTTIGGRDLRRPKEVITAKGADALYSPLVSGVIERTKSVLLQSNPIGGQGFERKSAAKLHAEYASRSAEILTEVAKALRLPLHRAGTQGHAHLLQIAARP